MRAGAGYSLAETLLSLLLFSMAFALVLPFLAFQKRQTMDHEIFRDEFRTFASAMDWLTRDLQEAGYHCQGTPVQELADESITYTLSRDQHEPSAFSSANRRLVVVYLNGGDLMYRIRAWDPAVSAWRKGSSHTLASGVTGLCFRGLDPTGSTAEEPGETTAVQITLSGRRAGTLSTLVALRNDPSGGGP